MVFALFALQVYKGELRNKCVLKMEDHNASYETWFKYVEKLLSLCMMDSFARMGEGNTCFAAFLSCGDFDSLETELPHLSNENACVCG